MDQPIKTPGRLSFTLGVGFLLWGISGAITVSLFLDLAGQNIGKILIAVLWAGSLEATKIITWRRSGQSRWLSIFLMALTLFSALGIAFQTVERTQEQVLQQSVSSSREYQNQLQLIDSLQRQIGVLVDRLAGLPPDYVTVAANLSKDISQLRPQLSEAQSNLRHLEGTALQDSRGQGTFELLAKAFNWNRKVLEIIVILIVATLTEVSAMAMAGHVTKRKSGEKSGDKPDDSEGSPKPAQKPAIPDHPAQYTPDDYLKAALSHPGAPRLLGREKVAKILGIAEPQARKLLAALVRSGRVQKGTKSYEVDPVPASSLSKVSSSRVTNP